MPTVTRGLYRWIFRRGATLEDFADRLSHFWTFAILLVFAAIISWKQGASDPIVCWCPAQFTLSMNRYVHSRCWNSHYIQYTRDIFEAEEALNMTYFYFPIRTEQDLSPLVTFTYPTEPNLLQLYSMKTTLYQWIPLIMVFQALLFKLPNVLLYVLHGYSGLSFDKLNGLTRDYEQFNMAERQVLKTQISRYISNWCNQMCNGLPWRYLTAAWLLTKVLFFINIVSQMYYLDLYLRTTDPPFDNSTSYGDVIGDNLFSNNGSLWKQSPVFPRNTLCDFSIRQLANIQKYTVQCDLPINEYNEVAFIFLWIWFLIVSIVTGMSLVAWLGRVCLPLSRQRYIWKMLRISDEFPLLTLNDTANFANWIGEDGVMALKLIGSNSSDLIVSDVVINMWKRRHVETGTRSVAHAHDVKESTSEQPMQSGPLLYPGLEENVKNV